MKEGRLGQDYAFSLPELVGLRIEAIFGVVDLPNPDTQPMVLNMKLSDGMWHRCFLHVGFTVWERHAWLVDDDAEGDGVRYVDYGRDHQLVGESLQRVEAKQTGPGELSTLTILLASGRAIQLAFSDPTDPESSTQMTVRIPAD